MELSFNRKDFYEASITFPNAIGEVINTIGKDGRLADLPPMTLVVTEITDGFVIAETTKNG